MAIGVFANLSSLSEYNRWFEEVNTAGMNFESPFGTNEKVTGYPPAQTYASTYMILKQRRRMVFEFYKRAGDVNPKQVVMYINPETLTMNNSKLYSKQITRGGIFYHHFGEDHASMQLRGTTGLSGMAGIRQLEEVYHASGTLLAYDNRGNTQIYGAVSSFEVLDYKDPVAVASRTVSVEYSEQMLQEIYNKLGRMNTNVNSGLLLNSALMIVENVNKNSVLSKVDLNIVDVLSLLEKSEPTYTLGMSQYRQKLEDQLKNKFPNFDESILKQYAYEITNTRFYNNANSENAWNLLVNNDSYIPTIAKMTSSFEKARREALQQYVTQLRDFQMRDEKIRDYLRAGLSNLKDELTDKWLPRLITIYFENRAYLGFFDTFNYSRDAKTNLITYDIKFIVTKQYEFLNTNDGFSPDSDAIVVTPTVPNKEETPPPQVDTKPEPPVNPPVEEKPSIEVRPEPSIPDDKFYTIKSGDVLEIITSKFYNYNNYSELRKLTGQLATYNNMYDADSIYPGQVIKLPDKSKLVNLYSKPYNGVVGDGK